MLSYKGVQTKEYKILVIPIVILVVFMNPLVEEIQSINPVVFMLDHYAMFFAGAVIGYRMFKGSLISLIVGAIIAALWHFPIPFDLAGSYVTVRVLCELTLILGEY